MKLKLTEDDRDTARFLVEQGQLFLDIRDTMTVRAFHAFGLVGANEGLSVQQYAWKAKAAPGTMSRSLLDMGPHNRWGQAGGLLIDSTVQYRNEKAHYLTEDGIKLLRKIAALRQGGDA